MKVLLVMQLSSIQLLLCKATNKDEDHLDGQVLEEALVHVEEDHGGEEEAVHGDDVQDQVEEDDLGGAARGSFEIKNLV